MNKAVFRQSCWMVTAPLAAVAIAYLVFLWLPGRRAIQAVQKQVETQRQFVAKSTGLQAALIAAQQELDKAESVVSRWEKTSPRKKEMSALYGKINTLAKGAGLSIVKFDPQPGVEYEKIRELPIAISCTGMFSQVYEFLRGMEGLPMTIWAKSVKLEKINGNAKDIRCELELAVFSNNP